MAAANESLGGRPVREFLETTRGAMPDTAEYAAIKAGQVRQSKSFPGAGSVKFIAYHLHGEQVYAIIRSLESGFDVPEQHRRFIIESYQDYETAAATFGLAVGWLVQLVQQYGRDLIDEDTLAMLTESAPADEPLRQ